MNKRPKGNQRKRPTGRRRPNQPTAIVDQVTPALQRARSVWMDGRYVDALRAFDAAVASEANNVRAFTDAARAYATRYEFEHADQLLERLIAIAPHHPGTHHLVADTWLRLKLLPRAMKAYERAAALDGVMPITFVELASLYERSNRLDEAQQMVDRALALQDLPIAQFVAAQIQNRRGEWEAAESAFLRIVRSVPESAEVVCRAWAEIASIRDRQGDYAAAMAATEKWKQIHLRRGQKEWQESERIVQSYTQLIGDVSRSDFREWAGDVPQDELPQMALLTGFPRSGTTLLEQVLDAHPQIVCSEERDFLAQGLFPQMQEAHSLRTRNPSRPAQSGARLIDVLRSLPPQEWREARQRYVNVMEWMLGESIGGRIHVDKNPAYMLTIPVMLRIFPQAKLIIALRDPRDVALSCYMTYLPLNAVSVRFTTLERIADRYVVDRRAWSRLREMIPPRQFVETRYEQLISDFNNTVRATISTLQLDWHADVANYRDRTREKQVSSPTYAAVSQPIHGRSRKRWKNYEKFLEPLFDRLGAYVDE